MSFLNDERWQNGQIESHKRMAEELSALLERIINFQGWRFQKTYTYIVPRLPPHIIYDSEWCRVQFSYEGGDYQRFITKVYYGRLHASNDKYLMTWNGVDCGCWHRVDHALNFLDGLSPQEAVSQLRSHQSPYVIEKYKQSEGKKLERDNEIEWMIRMHSSIWEHYGERLFEIYDVRKSDLWERYTMFQREYSRLVGVTAYPGEPGNDQMC
jgi:hypothetical protein